MSVTPPCYNRPERDKFLVRHHPRGGRIMIPVVFEDRCATHDGVGIGPNNESYPVAHDWNCKGCKWLPKGVSHE